MMRRRMVGKLLVLGALLALTGCGVIYTSPSVRPEGAGFQVDVVPVTQETLPFLNQSSYSPRGLPLYFRQVAGSASPQAPDLPQVPDLPEIVAMPVQLTLPPPFFGRLS